ncbi:MAG: DUF2393 domain-containing protein [Epsilonproteobacteria bacterium]|nr:DUF2393 domain-containing protein [Campylobacterota bacterium]
MKDKISAFINELIFYDYILFGTIFILFILFIVLSILLRHKTFFASFFMILSFVTLIVAPLVGYKEMHKFLFKNTIVLTSQKKLNFTKAVVVRGSIKNESKHTFKSCKITAFTHKVSKNKVKNYLYTFKSFKKMSILEESIKVGENRNFKIIIEPFTYSKDYNISLEAKCR